MKNCPFCEKPLSETAVRCRYCRRALDAPERPRADRIGALKRKAADLDRAVSAMPAAPWGAPSAAVFLLAAFALSWALAYFELSYHALQYLRRTYFIFTREPQLQIYTQVFIDTLLLKAVLAAAVVVFTLGKGERGGTALAIRRRFGTEWSRFVLVFAVFSFAVGWVGGEDPLIPNLPTHLFFPESALLGNIFAVVSVAVVAPLTEEIFFRGFLYPALSRSFGWVAGIAGTSLLFAAAHYPQMRENPGLLALIFAVGFLITSARALSGSTALAVYLHVFYNAGVLTAGFIHYWFYGY